MEEPSLRDYVAALRRRRMVAFGTVLVIALGTLVVSLLQTEQFQARAELLLRLTPSEEVLIDDAVQVRTANDAERQINNELRLIGSGPVRDAVDDAYDGPLEPRIVTAAATAENADVIELKAVSADRVAATDLVNTYAEVYVREQRQQRVDDLLAAGSNIQERIDELTTTIEEAQVAPSPETQPRIEALENQRMRYEDQLAQVRANADLTESGGVQVLTPADVPSNPISPKPLRNLVLGLVAGALVGIAVALLIDHLDDSIRSKEEAERLTGKPALGVIPRATTRKDRLSELASLVDPSSASAEAYRSLRTSVKFLGIDKPLRTVLVTSAAASEGKTVTAANLAAVLAQSGDRVLLVGADLRRARVQDLFGAPTSPGLTSLILEGLPTAGAVYELDELPNLHLMPSGPVPPNPAEILGSESAEALLRSLGDTYDIVVIDSPPVLPVTDAQVLSRYVDAVLVVVAYNETSRRGLGRAVELLGQVHAPVVGAVLNLVPTKAAYGGQPYRYQTYKSRSERRRQRERSSPSDVTMTPLHPVGHHAALGAKAGGASTGGNGRGQHDEGSAPTGATSEPGSIEHSDGAT